MAEEFSRHVARVVAAQIAESTGFDACQDSAIEVLGDLLLRYLSTLCCGSHSYAELAGRSQANLADVLLAMEDLGVTPEDLHQHIQLQGSDVPFAHTLAPFPVHTQQALPPSFADRREAPPAAHIPSFLPAFPDPHTYQHTPSYPGHQTDAHKQRQSMLEAKQKAEAALNKLHQRMTSKKAQADSNPYLAVPAVEALQLPAGATTAAAAAGAPAPAAGSTGTSTQPAPAAAGASAASQQQQQQPSLLPPLLPAAVAAAAAGESALDEEDALFESAVVLKAFSSLLPPDVLEEQRAKARGSGSNGAAGEQDQQQRQGKHGGTANGLEEVEDIEDVIMADASTANGDAAAAHDDSQGWLGWKQHQPPQQQPSQQEQQQQPSELLGPAGVSGPQLLQFGVDPLAAGKAIALSLAGRSRPADAYAERMSSRGKAGAAGGGGSGARQRKSKYDADPQTRQAEGILAASAEAMFVGTASDAKLAEVFDVEEYA